MKEQNEKLLHDLVLVTGASILTGFLIVYFPWSAISDLTVSEDLIKIVLTTIIQGFTGLVAFLGAVAVFILEGQRNYLGDLAREIEGSHNWHSILRNHRKVISDPKYYGRVMSKDEYLEASSKLYANWGERNKDDFLAMREVYSHDWEIRNRLMLFTTISFLNIGIALIFLVFVLGLDFLSESFRAFIVFVHIILSIWSLVYGWQLIRRGVGFAKKNE